MKKLLLFYSIFLLGNQFIQSQTTLTQGDIAFIGMNLDGVDDYAFILLTGIDASTTITFTDQGWIDGVGFNTASAGEGTWTWTSGAALSCGTVITITTNTPGFTASIGSVSGIAPVLSIIGDQIFAYQGSAGSPTLISGIHSNIFGTTDANWDGNSINNQTSALPDVLTNGVNAIRLHASEVESDNWRYNCAVVSGTAAIVRAAINNVANWTTDDVTPYTPVNPGCSWSVTCVAPCTDPTVPTITASVNPVCAGSTTTLNISGTLNDATQWAVYTGSCGGTILGTTTGSTFVVTPTGPSTTYYIRGEGGCVTPGSCGTVMVNVKEYIYAPTGSTSNTYCTDNNGWHHFYNSNDKIILSVQGDLTGAPAGYPIITINENTNFYQENESLTSTPADCSSGYSPQEQRFEMKRNWNVDFGGGTTNGTYNVRFYHKPEEKSYIEIAAINFMATYPSCGYSYKYNAGNLGFYWFKNSGTNYIAPQFDGIYHIAAGIGTISGINYAELQGITSFSGGSGAIILVPDASLLGTEDFENVNKFSVYPNPTSGLLNINTSFDGNFIIINQLGQIVHSFKATSNIENVINIENLTNGIYFIKGVNGTKVNSQKLIIKK